MPVTEGREWIYDPNPVQMLILYFAEKNVYDISLEKDGTEVRFDYYPATNEFEYNPQSIEPLRSVLTEAMGDNFMNAPMTIFKAIVQDRFDLNVEELYAMSKK